MIIPREQEYREHYGTYPIKFECCERFCSGSSFLTALKRHTYMEVVFIVASILTGVSLGSLVSKFFASRQEIKKINSRRKITIETKEGKKLVLNPDDNSKTLIESVEKFLHVN